MSRSTVVKEICIKFLEKRRQIDSHSIHMDHHRILVREVWVLIPISRVVIFHLWLTRRLFLPLTLILRNIMINNILSIHNEMMMSL